MNGGGFLARWARRKAQSTAQSAAQANAPADGQPAATEPQAEDRPHMDIDTLRSLWADNPTIGIPDGLDLDCEDFDSVTAERTFTDLWKIGRRIERQLAEAAGAEAPLPPGPPLV